MIRYPKSPKSDTVDYYHGIPVPDPFRPMEDIESKGVEEWIDRQNAFTDEYLSRIRCREAIRKRLEEVIDYEIWNLPRKHGDRYFVQRRLRVQKRSALYWSSDLKTDFHVLVDPNEFSPDGKAYLSEWSISPDGKKIAFALAASCCEWLDWYVRDVYSPDTSLSR